MANLIYFMFHPYALIISSFIKILVTTSLIQKVNAIQQPYLAPLSYSIHFVNLSFIFITAFSLIYNYLINLLFVSDFFKKLVLSSNSIKILFQNLLNILIFLFVSFFKHPYQTVTSLIHLPFLKPNYSCLLPILCYNISNCWETLSSAVFISMLKVYLLLEAY